MHELVEEILATPHLTFLSVGMWEDGGPVSGAFETRSAIWTYTRPFDIDEDVYARFALIHLQQRRSIVAGESLVPWESLAASSTWYRLSELPFAGLLKFEYRPGVPVEDWSKTKQFFQLQPWTESDVNLFWFSFESGLVSVCRGE